MQHLEHERLVFLALGESDADDGESTHLDTCAHCRTELTALRQVAGLGVETQGLGDLPDPPDHIWQGIAAEIGAAEAVPSLTEARRQQAAAQTTTGPATTGPATTGPATTGPATTGPATTGPATTGPATTVGPTTVGPATTGQRPGGSPAGPSGPGVAGPGAGRRSPARRRTGWSRWAATAVTAVAAAAIGVVGTVSVLRPDEPAPAPTPAVLASAPLAAFGSTPKSAQGDARVLQSGQLHLHVANLPRVPGYYEVWLINPTNMEMFSIGTLGGDSDAVLPLPPNVDLKSYSVVDVSAEQYDNNTRHSGDSLLRGTLTG
ncbi:anti-sigma factor [Micromonospora lupini]|uniref:anti-sigma factor n=1 Tax=Micromonospora lupini TaxID=285679 RepID=UPI00224D71E7|nr:anti-sigma factor [Micromonospora lupini]MCX5069616.1 anti-sigma factor [Micromonospora lupini]